MTTVANVDTGAVIDVVDGRDITAVTTGSESPCQTPPEASGSGDFRG